MANKKGNDFAPTFGDLRENHGYGDCGEGVKAAKSPRSASQKLTANSSELPDLTRPTR